MAIKTIFQWDLDGIVKNYFHNNMRILVTGGSGFIGTNVMDYLIEQNIETINYDIKSPKKEAHFRFWREVDLRNKEILEKEMMDFKPTHILHLAAITGMEVKDDSIFKVNTDGVVNIIKCAEKYLTVKRIVFVSSLLVCKYGYIPKNDTDYCPPNLYGKSKVSGEKIIRKLENPSFTWCIVRPTSIWGPMFDYSYKTFFKTIDKNRYLHIGKNEFQKPASFVGNTVHMMMKILLVDNPTINKSTFYLADYPWYSTRKWANTIQSVLNSKKINTAPLWLLRIIALMGDVFKKIFNYNSPLTSFRLNNMLTGGAYPVDNVKGIVGDLPYNLKESVYITAKWMFDNNLIKHKPRKV